MAKSRTRARKQQAAAAAARTGGLSISAASHYGGGWSGQSGYIATQESPARGRMVTLDLDTRRQLTPWARLTLILKSRTLVENYGPAKALRNLAALIGSLKPQANSGDPAWDALAEKRFNEIANSPLIFDAAGKRTFATWQTFTTFRRFTDGDIFSILTETTTGAARIAGREAHQCHGGDDKFNDGIRTDANGFPLAYNFRTFDGGKDYILQPPAIHHHAEWSTLGGTRGTPVLAHAINDMHDALEIKGFVKRAIKTAALMGLTRRADTSTGGMPPGVYGAAAPIQSDNFAPPGAGSGTITTPQRVTFEDVFDSGILSSVPLDVVHDDRPHPNAEEFQKRLLRECAIGLGVPPALLFFMDEPGGAEIRTHLEIFARFIVDQHANHLLPFCQRFWTYAIAKEMKNGTLPAPSKGDWWRVRWCPPKNITADLGKMGNLLIALRKACLTTYAAHYEALGLNYEDELEQCAREARLMLDLEAKYQLPPGTLAASLIAPGTATPTLAAA